MRVASNDEDSLIFKHTDNRIGDVHNVEAVRLCQFAPAAATAAHKDVLACHRRALSGLVEGGYVQSVHGKGVQVIYQPVSDKTAFTVGGIESFQETARRNKLRPITRVVRFQTLSADEALARESGFPLGSHLLMIHRVRTIDGKRLILDINYFLEELVPGLTPEIAKESIYAYLEKQLGMQIVTSKRRITVERANTLDRECLDLEGYDCLAVVTSNTFNSDGVMFEYTQSRHHPEYFSFQDTATRKRW